MGLGKQAAAAIAAAMIACVSGAASAQQAAPTATDDQVFTVLDYLFKFAHADEAIDVKFREMLERDPTFPALFEGFTFDLPTMLHAMAERAAPGIAADEIAVCTAFIASPHGDRLMVISQGEASVDTVIPKLAAMPERETKEMADFMVAPCTQKLVAFMNSAESKALGREMGQKQSCAFFLPKADAVQKQRLFDAGYCKD